MKLDRESEELERAYPGILARLDTEPLERVAREYRITRAALFHARERYRRLRTAGAVHVDDRAKPERAPASAPAADLPVRDPVLQAGLEDAYPGITAALARRDDVEVAVQFGISLGAIAAIRSALGVMRFDPTARPTTPAAPRALPSRLVAARE